LFDNNWGMEYPLTRLERLKLESGPLERAPFFEPPTTANASNYIADKLALLRNRFGITEYRTASDISKLCAPGGSSITCEGPDGGIGWSSTTATLSASDVERFKAAYCDPFKCHQPGTATPPPGFTERVIKGRPRNAATAGKVGCEKPPNVEVNGPELLPLGPLDPVPQAEAPPKDCPTPDVILGRDDGPFASGWWWVDRCGKRLLVPNPRTF
jgi:hypothetical protein